MIDIENLREILFREKIYKKNKLGVEWLIPGGFDKALTLSEEVKEKVLSYKNEKHLRACLKLHLEEIPKCPYCGEEKSLLNTPVGYHQTCGNRQCYQKAYEETLQERYGERSVFKVPEIKNKITQTFIKNWGVENPGALQKLERKEKQLVLKNMEVFHLFVGKK